MGLFDVFKRGLKKTRDKIVAGLRTVLPLGRKIDETLLEELGTRPGVRYVRRELRSAVPSLDEEDRA